MKVWVLRFKDKPDTYLAVRGFQSYLQDPQMFDESEALPEGVTAHIIKKYKKPGYIFAVTKDLNYARAWNSRTRAENYTYDRNCWSSSGQTILNKFFKNIEPVEMEIAEPCTNKGCKTKVSKPTYHIKFIHDHIKEYFSWYTPKMAKEYVLDELGYKISTKSGHTFCKCCGLIKSKGIPFVKSKLQGGANVCGFCIQDMAEAVKTDLNALPEDVRDNIIGERFLKRLAKK